MGTDDPKSGHGGTVATMVATSREDGMGPSDDLNSTAFSRTDADLSHGLIYRLV